ncbi:LacI family transcriptional regulator [Cupriavidus gilardii]|uniref:LacI family DNA-binding transcriptional regulator n=1 Tax=Cupriavidus gilardii TaxID=82541 RepID=UPI0021BF5450|nr:LacI family DNA-binding transcriptional regulator [Cupriavidus gilardii]MCT9115473.1 LacI family transcriptional regulator [Cupriavidus gilardii]
MRVSPWKGRCQPRLGRGCYRLHFGIAGEMKPVTLPECIIRCANWSTHQPILGSMPTDSGPVPPAKPAATRSRASRPRSGTYTVHDVARMAGVSSVTVSRYFNEPQKVSEALRTRLAQVIEQTGYVPNQMARILATNQGGVVGAVMQNVTSPTFADMVRGMMDVAERNDLQLLLANSHFSRDSEARALRTFAGWHPRALILTRGDHSPESDALLARLKVPIVEAWEVHAGRPFHQVGFSQQVVGRMLAEHLVGQGALRIRFVLNGAVEDGRATRRSEGYAQAMHDAGLVPDVWRARASDDVGAAREAMAALAAMPPGRRPRAVIFANDNMAITAILCAHSHGLAIPGDLAVAGFGDAPLAAVTTPSLTTVRPDPYAIGSRAMEIVVTSLHAGTASAGPQVQEIACDLVIRESSRVVR